MTAEIYLQTIFEVIGCAVLTVFMVSVLIVVTYYSYKMAEVLIRDRKKLAVKIKKSKSFNKFNEPLKAVPKKVAKA
jgi:hypothetical protein